jgi:hypothetical protein
MEARLYPAFDIFQGFKGLSVNELGLVELRVSGFRSLLFCWFVCVQGQAHTHAHTRTHTHARTCMNETPESLNVPMLSGSLTPHFALGRDARNDPSLTIAYTHTHTLSLYLSLSL